MTPSPTRSRTLPLLVLLPLLTPLAAVAQATLPTTRETIEVTATRIPEDVEVVPASITVVSGDELAARGVTDLAGALALAAGVVVAPGGDGGPGGSVPELWGLREADAFLLVVDGVPWGGAFNPALPTLDLTDVDRIEVLRGAAPVMYGATSFVGVIHVLHRRPGAGGRTVRLAAGSYGSGEAALAAALPSHGRLRHSLAVNGERLGFRDDRTEVGRAHLLYRAAAEGAGGTFRFDLDATLLRQDPASPHPREGAVLSPRVPLDANHNPAGARLDEDRLHLVGGYERSLEKGSWSTTVAVTRSQRDVLRGFLDEGLAETDPNARGFAQEIATDDVYFDSHLAWRASDHLHLVAGVDHLFGSGDVESEVFDYFVPLAGGSPAVPEVPDEELRSKDRRNFSGLYAQVEWTPAPRWRILAGARLNHTDEEQEGEEEEVGAPPGGGEEGDEGRDHRSFTRASGVLGISWLAWSQEDDALWIYGDYRNTFKPAALDFGPEAEAEILDPEDAESYEVGLKGRMLDGRLDWQLSGFQMDFDNLVLSQVVDGLPRLVNAGSQRFRGGEVEARLRIRKDLTWQASWAYHDARFRDYLRLFDGQPVQLSGHRLELSARQLAATALVYASDRGWTATVLLQRVGSRFLNQRNTASAPAYTTWSAGVGYRLRRGVLRLDATNLNDTRPPAAESELGDAQFYRLPARALSLSWTGRW